MAPRLVLASASPARRRVLADAGFDPEVVVSGVEEDAGNLDTPAAVLLLAQRKAEVVAAALGADGALVLGCDSLLDLDGRALGKPGSPDAALAMWQRLSGRQATLQTGHCLIDTGSGKRRSAVGGTIVRFGRPNEAELAAYVATGEPLTLAGACSLEGFGAPFVDGIDGDPSNVLGLSLPLFRRLLAELGVAITDLWRRAARGVNPTIRDIRDDDRAWLARLLQEEWGLPMVSISGAHDPSRYPGLVAEEAGERLGVLTYREDEDGMEVVTLDSLVENQGVGTALLDRARRRAEQTGRRLWLVTTNENIRAIAFYQRRGMDMVGFHRDFAERVRRAKPGLRTSPDVRGITFRHALEFEYPGAGRQRRAGRRG